MIVKEFGGFYAVTPSNTADLPEPAIALWIGGTGTIVADDFNGHTSVTFSAIPAGSLLRGNFKRVRATSSATLIVALTSP